MIPFYLQCLKHDSRLHVNFFFFFKRSKFNFIMSMIAQGRAPCGNQDGQRCSSFLKTPQSPVHVVNYNNSSDTLALVKKSSGA